MGLGVSREIYQFIKYLLENYKGKLLIDADGLNCLSKYGIEILREAKCDVVLTPHVLEFARLIKLDKELVLNERIELAKKFAKDYKVVLILKSNSSIICIFCIKRTSFH